MDSKVAIRVTGSISIALGFLLIFVFRYFNSIYLLFGIMIISMGLNLSVYQTDTIHLRDLFSRRIPIFRQITTLIQIISAILIIYLTFTKIS